jgi:hypothetical protein
MKQYNVPEEAKIPFDYTDSKLPEIVQLLRPLLYRDGELICSILGPDPKQGVFGSGMTPEEAIIDWQRNLKDRLDHHSADDEVAEYIIDSLKTSGDNVW